MKATGQKQTAKDLKVSEKAPSKHVTFSRQNKQSENQVTKGAQKPQTKGTKRGLHQVSNAEKSALSSKNQIKTSKSVNALPVSSKSASTKQQKGAISDKLSEQRNKSRVSNKSEARIEQKENVDMNKQATDKPSSASLSHKTQKNNSDANTSNLQPKPRKPSRHAKQNKQSSEAADDVESDGRGAQLSLGAIMAPEEDGDSDQGQEEEDLAGLSKHVKELKSLRDDQEVIDANRAMDKLKKVNGEVLSIFKVIETCPSQFKSIIDRLIVSHSDDDGDGEDVVENDQTKKKKNKRSSKNVANAAENQSIDSREFLTNLRQKDKKLLKVVFLYFFELMGLNLKQTRLQKESEESVEAANNLFDILLRNYGGESSKIHKAIQEIDDLFKDHSKTNQIIFVQNCHLVTEKQSSEAATHKKYFKRFAKVFVTSLIDMYPDHSHILNCLTQRLSMFIGTKNRFIRSTFVQISIGIFKAILEQRALIENYVSRPTLDSQVLIASQKREFMSSCIELIDLNILTLGKAIFCERRHDPQEYIRKLVIEGLVSLEMQHLSQAQQIKELDLVKIGFDTLREQSQQIRKLAIQFLWQLVVKHQERTTEMVGRQELVRLFNMQKHLLVRLSQPLLQYNKQDQPEQTIQQTQDPLQMVKVVQIIQSLLVISQQDNLLDAQSITSITNLVHYQDQRVREAVGGFIISLSDEFEDGVASLLPLQIIQTEKENRQKIDKTRGIQLQLPFQMGGETSLASEQTRKTNKGNQEINEINFIREPRKSKRQILKLFEIISKYCKTPQEFIMERNSNNESLSEQQLESSVTQIEKMDQLSQIALQIFGQMTSVLFDTTTILEMTSNDQNEREDLALFLGSLLYNSLSFVQKQLCIENAYTETFKQIHQTQIQSLTLPKVVTALKLHSVNSGVTNQLLKSYLLVLFHQVKSIDDNSTNSHSSPNTTLNVDVSADVYQSNSRELNQVEPVDEGQVLELLQLLRASIQKNEQHMAKLSMAIMNKIYKVYPQAKESCDHVIKELIQSQWNLTQVQYSDLKLNTSSEIQQQLLRVIENSQKFSEMIGSVNLSGIASVDDIHSWIKYLIEDTTGLIGEDQLVSGLIESQHLERLFRLQMETIRLFGRLDIQEMVKHIRKNLQAIIDNYLAALLKIYDLRIITSTHQSKFEVFKTILTTLQIITLQWNSLDNNSAQWALPHYKQIENIIINAIKTAAQPCLLPENISEQYFSTILAFLSMNTDALLGIVGAEFIINFSLHHSQLQNHLSQRITSVLRKFLHCQKMRDSAIIYEKKRQPKTDPNRSNLQDESVDLLATPKKDLSALTGKQEVNHGIKSIFYGLVFKCISLLMRDDPRQGLNNSLNESSLIIEGLPKIDINSRQPYSNEQLLSFLKATQSEMISQMRTNHDLPTNNQTLVRQYLKTKVVQSFLRFVLGSIVMAVKAKSKQQPENQLHANQSDQFQKVQNRQEELVFCQFVEDFLNKASKIDKDFKEMNSSLIDIDQSNTSLQIGNQQSSKYSKLIMLLCLPQLMHGSFLAPKTQKKFSNLVKMKLQLLDEDKQLTSIDKAVKNCLIVIVDQILAKVSEQMNLETGNVNKNQNQKKDQRNEDQPSLTQQYGVKRVVTAKQSKSMAKDGILKQDNSFQIDPFLNKTIEIEPFNKSTELVQKRTRN